MPKSKFEFDNLGLPVGVYPGAGLVLGEGPVPCTWMFIGEAPDYGEDVEGRPFIGPSGRLLDRFLSEYAELKREDVYVTNVSKHRPPENRTPTVPERRLYLKYLYAEIERVQPKVIVALGGTALWVFNKDWKVTHEHGTARLAQLTDVWSGVLVPWFRPAYALRSTAVLVQALVDAQRLQEEVANVQGAIKEPAYKLVEDSKLASMLLSVWGEIGFDTETTSPTRGGVFQTDEAELVGYSVSQASGSGYYVASDTVGLGLAGILESPLWTKVCHNVKFDFKVLAKAGIGLVGYEDPRLGAYLLGEPRTGLKVLSRQYLGVQPTAIRELWPEGLANQPKQVALERYRDNHEYAAADADNVRQLWPLIKERLEREDLLDVYRRIELPLVPVLARMEGLGMGIDVPRCHAVAAELNNARKDAAAQVYAAAHSRSATTFNINSPDQLAAWLEEQDAPLKKRTEKHKRLVVDRPALESIREWWPELVEPLLDYRKYVKFIGYVTSYPELVAADGRVHTSFNQAGHYEEDGSDSRNAPSTGRLSSSGPNLGNIPHHRAKVGEVDWAVAIRSCIVAAPGKVLMSIDLAQEEPRIIAVAADDDTLMEGFKNGRDIYRPATLALYPYTASALSDHDFKRDFDYARFVGKTFFLAWYYGAGAGRLRTLDKELTAQAAKAAIELLSSAHPARERYLDYIRQELYDHAVITSLHGRKRWFWKAWSRRKIPKGKRWPVGKDWEAAVREGANMRIQATAADILKMAMVKIDHELEVRRFEARLVSTVYDEVVLELPPAEVQAVFEMVSEIFRPMLPGLDLEVEARVGENWGEMEGL